MRIELIEKVLEHLNGQYPVTTVLTVIEHLDEKAVAIFLDCIINLEQFKEEKDYYDTL